MPILDDLKLFMAAVGGQGKKIFIIGADATGDIPHVHAAYRGKGVDGVLIFEWNPTSAEGMLKKFVDLGMDKGRVKAVKLTTAEINAAKPDLDKLGTNSKTKSAVKSAKEFNDVQGRNAHRDYLTYVCRAVGFSVPPLHDSTSLAGKSLETDLTRKQLHMDFRGIKGMSEADTKYQKFWSEQFKQVSDADSAFKQNVVVLWGRSSGKTKTSNTEIGPHIYGDSSTTGMVQVAKKVLSEKVGNVVVAGDFTEEKKSRFTGCVFIGKFWGLFGKFGIDNTQQNQIRLFYILKLLLKENGAKRLVHVGMRSGNLDYYAFAGQTIIYLVPVGFDDFRIVQLAGIRDENYPKVPKPPPAPPAVKTTRWIQSMPEAVPRVAYRKDLELPPEVENAVSRSVLNTLLAPQTTRFNMLNTSLKSKPEDLDSYPLDTATQINANILYRAIKQALKDNPNLEGAAILKSYFQQTRGFSEAYLNQLLGRIRAALKISEGTDATSSATSAMASSAHVGVVDS